MVICLVPMLPGELSSTLRFADRSDRAQDKRVHLMVYNRHRLI